MDESGEDYLFPDRLFSPISLPQSLVEEMALSAQPHPEKTCRLEFLAPDKMLGFGWKKWLDKKGDDRPQPLQGTTNATPTYKQNLFQLYAMI
jgi:hypothetical protein